MTGQIRIRAGLLALLALLAARAGAAAPDAVPLHFIGGLPFVFVRVGAVQADMMFDSGGPLGISIPEPAVAASGSVTLLPEKARFSDIQGKVYEVPRLVARDVVVGHTRLPPVDGRVHVQWGGAPEGAADPLTRAREAGALGLAAFGDRPVLLDYAQRTMTVYPPGAGPRPDAPGWHALRLAFGKEGPYVMLRVGGKPLKFVLDTGSPITLVNTGSLPAAASGRCAAAAGDCDPAALADVRDEGGQPLGALRAQPAALGGAPFDGLLGAGFFADRRVVFDVAAHRLLIAAANGKQADRP